VKDKAHDWEPDKHPDMTKRTVLEEQVTYLVETLSAYDPEQIILFGSQARGEADEYSDLDLVVIKDTDERFLDRLSSVYELAPEVGAMDVLVYTPTEFVALQEEGRPFIQQVIRDGIVLYDRSQGTLPWQPPAGPAGGGWSAMKREEEGRSWLEQAQADLAAAEWLLEGKHYHAACFWAQQVAEKALKAFLYLQGERYIVEHSIYRLGQTCAEHDPSFAQLVRKLGALDRFYIPTRYPNGLPLGGVPAQTYGPDDAQMALTLAKQALRVVEVLFASPNSELPDHEKMGDDKP